MVDLRVVPEWDGADQAADGFDLVFIAYFAVDHFGRKGAHPGRQLFWADDQVMHAELSELAVQDVAKRAGFVAAVHFVRIV